MLVSADGRKSATPAFLLREGDTLVVRDVRLSHRPERQRVNRVRVSFDGVEEVSSRDARVQIRPGWEFNLRVDRE